jgi:hypothetical protein
MNTSEAVEHAVEALVKDYSGAHEANRYDTAILIGLQRKPHIYGGTVKYAVKQKRRIKGKLARAARRINR